MASRGVNKVILVGNLGQDPEVRYMPNGGAVANITLATSESWRDKQTGEMKEQTEWHRVVLFGRVAEIAAEYLRKGSQCYIEGRPGGARGREVSEYNVPEGWKLVPVEPTEEMWGGLARDLMMWLDFDNKTVEALRRHLTMLNVEWPKWMDAEEELKWPGVPSKGTRATLIYKAMLAAAPAAPVVQHSDDAAVDRFAAAMKEKLAAARAKGRAGWDDPNACPVETLAKLLISHLRKGNAGTFEDVANFAMMLHQRGADPRVLAEAAPAVQEPVGHELDGLAGDLLVAADLVRNKAVSSRLVEYSRHVAKLAYCTPAPDAVLVEALERASKVMWSAECNLDVEAQEIERVLTAYRAALAGKGGKA